MKTYSAAIRAENWSLRHTDLDSFIAANEALPHTGTSPRLEALRRRRETRTGQLPYCFFTITYAGTYFGTSQCIDFDSIRAAIDRCFQDRKLTRWQRTWALLALARVACRVNTSTGHFAQIRKGTAANLERLLAKRRRNVWSEFLQSLEEIGPEGDQAWRRGNRAFNSETLTLLTALKSHRERPAVIYADPPYSKAQYSRYYHVLDSLLTYSYAATSGVARYPIGRHQTAFSNASTVEAAMEELVLRSANLKAALVLSYPSGGLYCQRGGKVRELLARHYRNVDLAISASHRHSTFGGPTAGRVRSVRELVYVATAVR